MIFPFDFPFPTIFSAFAAAGTVLFLRRISMKLLPFVVSERLRRFPRNDEKRDAENEETAPMPGVAVSPSHIPPENSVFLVGASMLFFCDALSVFVVLGALAVCGNADGCATPPAGIRAAVLAFFAVAAAVVPILSKRGYSKTLETELHPFAYPAFSFDVRYRAVYWASVGAVAAAPPFAVLFFASFIFFFFVFREMSEKT